MKKISVCGTYYDVIDFQIDFEVSDNFADPEHDDYIDGGCMVDLVYEQLMLQDPIFPLLKDRDNHVYRCTQVSSITDEDDVDLYEVDDGFIVDESSPYEDPSEEQHALT